MSRSRRALLRSLRASDAWIPALSLVAERDGAVAGHVVCTRGDVDGAPALGLGPISVAPPLQRAGVGSALMHAVLAAAEARDEQLVCLLGDPAFYVRFGFAAAADLGVAAPDPPGARTSRPARSRRRPRGTFAYAGPFGAF